MNDHHWYVEYSNEFVEQLVTAPQWVKAEFEKMYFQLVEEPRESAAYTVEQSVDDPNEYHMEFSWPSVWITYRVDETKRRVKIAILMNPEGF